MRSSSYQESFFLKTTQVPDNDQYSHFKMESITKIPFIFTNSITFCVGISFYDPGDQNQAGKLAMYHSYSEHLEKDEGFVSTVLKKTKDQFQNYDEKQYGYFIHAIRDFFKDIDDPKRVQITIHINTKLNTAQSFDYEVILSCINTVLKALNKKYEGKIIEQHGGPVFFISNDGDAVSPANHQDYEPIAKKIYDYIIPFLKADKNLSKKLSELFSEVEIGKKNYLQACYHIQNTFQANKFNDQGLYECFLLLQSPFVNFEIDARLHQVDEILKLGNFYKNDQGDWVKDQKKEKKYSDTLLNKLYTDKHEAIHHLATYLDNKKDQLLTRDDLDQLKKLITNIQETSKVFQLTKHKKTHMHHFFKSKVENTCNKLIEQFEKMKPYNS